MGNGCELVFYCVFDLLGLLVLRCVKACYVVFYILIIRDVVCGISRVSSQCYTLIIAMFSTYGYLGFRVYAG